MKYLLAGLFFILPIISHADDSVITGLVSKNPDANSLYFEFQIQEVDTQRSECQSSDEIQKTPSCLIPGHLYSVGLGGGCGAYIMLSRSIGKIVQLTGSFVSSGTEVPYFDESEIEAYSPNEQVHE